MALKALDGLVFEPHPADTCRVIFRRAPHAQPAIFEGNVYFPAIPKLQPHEFKALVKTDLFSLVVSQEGCHIETREDIKALTPSAWLSYWRLAAVLASGKGTMEIVPDKYSVSQLFTLNKKADGQEEMDCEFMIGMWERVETVFRVAGVPDSVELTHEAVMTGAKRISSLHKIIKSEGNSADFSIVTDPLPQITEPLSMDILCADYLSLPPTIIAYTATATIKPEPSHDHVVWRGCGLQLHSITVAARTPDEYKRFVDEAQAKTGRQNIWMRKLETGTPAMSPELA